MARLAPSGMAAPAVSSSSAVSPSSSSASAGGLSARAAALLSPIAALAITVVVGALLFAALGKPPGRALSMFFIEPLRDARALSRAGDQGDAAGGDRARAGDLVPRQRLEHRRRGAVHPGRDRRHRGRAAGGRGRRPLGRARAGRRRDPGRDALGGGGGLPARSLLRERDPGQPDAGLRRRAAARLPGLRALEGSRGVQLSPDDHLPARRRDPASDRGPARELGLSPSRWPAAPARGCFSTAPTPAFSSRSAGIAPRAAQLRRVLAAARALDGAADLGRARRVSPARWRWRVPWDS